MDFESKCYWAARIFDNYNSSDNNANMSNEDYTPDYHNEANANDDNQFDFLFNNGSIRYFNHAGIVWFIGKDICDYLEYNNPAEAIRDHVSPTNAMHFSYGDICKGLAENQDIAIRYILESSKSTVNKAGMLCITEQGVYELTRFSRMPKADKFYEWIHNRVLPSIRQTGVYSTPTARAAIENDSEAIYPLLTQNDMNQMLQTGLADIRSRSINASDCTYRTYGSLEEAMVANLPEPIRQQSLDFARGMKVMESAYIQAVKDKRKSDRTVERLRREKKEVIAENETLKKELEIANRKNNPVAMCSIIPDDIRGKLSYEEYRKINPIK